MWQGSWYTSYIRRPRTELAQIHCDGVFSDVLYRPYQCANIDLDQFAANVPQKRQIPRIPNLSPAEFQSEWTRQPFILTDPVGRWPVSHKWSMDALVKEYSTVEFRAEAVDWPLETYAAYMEDNMDESPLYLFDRAFAEKMRLTAKGDGDYWPPACFGEDLFALLGSHRPDCRWLIIGPKRGGSTFHKDPNATR